MAEGQASERGHDSEGRTRQARYPHPSRLSVLQGPRPDGAPGNYPQAPDSSRPDGQERPDEDAGTGTTHPDRAGARNNETKPLTGHAKNRAPDAVSERPRVVRAKDFAGLETEMAVVKIADIPPVDGRHFGQIHIHHVCNGA